jgi:hypothetical protein
MKTRIALLLLIALTTLSSQLANAQQTKPPEELPKGEVGIDFMLTTTNSGPTLLPGAGARLTYNLNRHFALEGAAYFSPGTCQSCSGELTGHMTQGMFGIKAGQRFKKFGLFVKARPGVINLSQAEFDLVPTGSSQPLLSGSFLTDPPFKVVTRSRTDFALDVGPVVEIYAKKNFFLRFDAGLLIERVGSRTFHSYQFDGTTGSFQPLAIKVPGRTIGHFQFTSGVGFRF